MDPGGLGPQPAREAGGGWRLIRNGTRRAAAGARGALGSLLVLVPLLCGCPADDPAAVDPIAVDPEPVTPAPPTPRPRSAAERLMERERLMSAGNGSDPIRRDPPPRRTDPTPPEDTTPALDPEQARIEADKLILSGYEKLDRRDPQGAFDAFSKAIELDAEKARAWHGRGMVKAQRNDLDGAFQDLSRASELAPDETRIWLDRAQIRLARRDVQGAVADFGKAVELGEVRAYYSRAQARLMIGDHEGALDDLTASIQNNVDRMACIALRGRVYMATKEFDKAIAEFDLVLERDPTSVSATLGRAQARSEKGDHAGAADDLQRFVDAAPTDPNSAAFRQLIPRVRAGEKLSDMLQAAAGGGRPPPGGGGGGFPPRPGGR